VSQLSRQYALAPGDLIYTGTPAGVGPVVSGDEVTGEIEGIGTITISIAEAR
jgi:fumarylpyruvate hydrolase